MGICSDHIPLPAFIEVLPIGWLSQLTQILQEIHNRGIFHRDIKPSNLILQPDGQLVAIDFGAAKQAAVVTASGQRTRIYTPGYAAPEQEQGEASAQSDFFALGRTFVYLLTAKEPTELHDSYRDLLLWRDKTTNVSADFLDLIDRLMQADPHQRPDTTATIFREIAALSPTITRQSMGSQPPATSTTPTFKISQPKVVAPSTPLSSSAPQRLSPSKKLLPALVVLTALLLLLPAIAMYLLGNKQPLIPGITSKNTGESFAAIKDVPQGTFKFGGSTTWATTRQLQSSIDAAIKGVYPQFEIVYTDASSPDFKSVKNGKCDSKPGSNAGICWLLAGDLDFSQSSISLDKSIYKDDARVKAHQLKQEAVAYDALSIVVNPKLNLTGLTIDQLHDIYTGRFTNWRQVGGPNLPIVAFARPESTGGTVSSFYDLVLKKDDKQQFRDDKWQPQLVGSTTEGLQKVSKNLGGIYYGAAKEVIIDSCNTKPLAIGKTADNLVKPYREPLQSPAACRNGQRNQLNATAIKSQTYPLTRQIYVIIKTTNLTSQKAGEAYANLLKTQQGQQLLEKAGFVSISN
jgi:phosphate transport system substrate-binding protein